MLHRNKRLGLGLFLMLLVANVLVSAASDTKVLYDRNGSALMTYNGPKDRVPSFRARSGSTPSAQIEGLTQGSYDLTGSRSASFGDGDVITAIDTRVEWGTEFVYLWRNLSGQTTTAWTGEQPQAISAEVELSETIKFSGIGISVSVPGGVGATASGSTINWSGDDRTHGICGTSSATMRRSRLCASLALPTLPKVSTTSTLHTHG